MPTIEIYCKSRPTIWSITTATALDIFRRPIAELHQILTKGKSEASERSHVIARVNVAEAHLSQKHKYDILTGLSPSLVSEAEKSCEMIAYHIFKNTIQLCSRPTPFSQ